MRVYSSTRMMKSSKEDMNHDTLSISIEQIYIIMNGRERKERVVQRGDIIKMGNIILDDHQKVAEENLDLLLNKRNRTTEKPVDQRKPSFENSRMISSIFCIPVITAPKGSSEVFTKKSSGNDSARVLRYRSS